MIRKFRKGFTIVELVIVIAVIAVLTAVLVPTFIHLSKKAKSASDNSLVTNLNTALKMDAGEGHAQPRTMQDAVDALKRQGYLVPQLSTKSEDKLVYSIEKNEFCLSDKVAEGEEYKYWHIEKGGMPSTQLFSIYAFEWTTSQATGLTVGFDAGEEGINNVEFVGGHDVVIRTVGGTLTIDAENNTVNHYGEGIVLDIKAIAGSSYHEYGHFRQASIAQGRMVIENEGDITSVEITAVPSSSNPIKIETSKDIVVSASPEVVAELGSNTLDNVEVKVTSSDASVVVDEKINTSNVDAAGKTAGDLVKITKVSNYSELTTALSATKSYIMFTADISYPTNGSGLLNITYSTTLDGNGHKFSGHGLRGSAKTTICLNNSGTQMIDVGLANLTISNPVAGGRPVESRGNIKSLDIRNCNIRCENSGSYAQGITVGGNQSTKAKISIKDSTVYCPKYYGFITFNPVDLKVEGSEFEAWAALYMKSPSSSAGSRGSVIVVNNSKLVCINNNSGASDDFGAIVFEDGSINVTVKNTSIDVTEKGEANQSAVVFSSGWASIFGTILKQVKVSFENVTIKGSINDEEIEYDSTNVVIIQSGQTTNDPTPYLADGSTVSNDDLFYTIQNRGYVGA